MAKVGKKNQNGIIWKIIKMVERSYEKDQNQGCFGHLTQINWKRWRKWKKGPKLQIYINQRPKLQKSHKDQGLSVSGFLIS